MQVSGQLHIPTDLPPRKEPPYPLGCISTRTLEFTGIMNYHKIIHADGNASCRIPTTSLRGTGVAQSVYRLDNGLGGPEF
jgi:hypothetical protein